MRAADGAGECCKRELEGEGCDPGAGLLAGEGQHIPEGLERAALAVCCLGSREGWIDTVDLRRLALLMGGMWCWRMSRHVHL